MFCKIDALRNFAKFTEKHLCQRLFFNKVTGLRAATLLKMSFWHKCFLVILQNFQEHLFLENTYGGCFCILEDEIHYKINFSLTMEDKSGLIL